MKKVKKLLTVICVVLACTGCRNNGDVTAKPVQNDMASVVWEREPDIDALIVRELTPNQAIDVSAPYMTIDFQGYPQEWLTYFPLKYTPDAIVLLNKDHYEIRKYDGTLLFSDTEHSDPYDNPIYMSMNSGYGFIITIKNRLTFSEDFTALEEDKEYELPEEHAEDFDDELVFMDGKFYMYDWTDGTPVDFKGTGSPCIIKECDNDGVEFNDDGTVHKLGNTINYLLLDGEGNLVKKLPGYPVHFVNGYITLDLVNKGHNIYQILNGTTGEPINNDVYFGAKFFENGYCPVSGGNSKSKKWGFINEGGYMVSEFCFDDASTLYEGNAYVSHNGKYGVLNVKQSVEDGAIINGERCFGEEIEKDPIPTGRSYLRINKEETKGYSEPGFSNDSQDCRFIKDMLYERVSPKEVDGTKWYKLRSCDKDEVWVPVQDGDEKIISEMDVITYTTGTRIKEKTN